MARHFSASAVESPDPRRPTSLVVLGDPVGGERLLGIEELLDVVKDQILERAADERDVHLADADEPKLAAGIGFGQEVPAAEVAGPVRDAGAVAAFSRLLVWS